MNVIKVYRRWLLAQRVKKAKRLFVLIDRETKRVGMPRQVRRRMWGDFVKSTRHGEILELLEG